MPPNQRIRNTFLNLYCLLRYGLSIGAVPLTSTISPAHLRRVIGITVLILLVMLWLPAGRLEAQPPADSPSLTPLRFERLSQNAEPARFVNYRHDPAVLAQMHTTLSFWQTRWFQGALALLAVLVMVGGLYSWRVLT